MWSGPKTMAELCEALDAKPAQVRERIKPLIETGAVIRRMAPTGPMERKRKVVYHHLNAIQLALPL